MDIDKELKAIAEDIWLTQVRNYVPSAWIGHAPFLRLLIRELKPNVFVELGTHNGFSYFVGCQTVQELALPTKTYAVDHWVGDPHAGEFDASVYEGVVAINAQYKTFSTLLKMSFIDASSKFEDGTVNLLHIDGFHTYEAVKEDFETWLKLGKSGCKFKLQQRRYCPRHSGSPCRLRRIQVLGRIEKKVLNHRICGLLWTWSCVPGEA